MHWEKTLREICTDTGVSRRAVQGYEKAGLVSPSGKNKYGYLLYDLEAEDRIRRIRFYQQIGFSLKEIRAMLHASGDEQKAALESQAEKLKARKEELQSLIDRIYQEIAAL